MVFGSTLLSLGLLTASISAAVLPRSKQPCPHHEPDGELLNQYIVEFHHEHTLEDHFATIGKDLRQGPELHSFRYLDTLHMYRAVLTEEFVHNFVRYDPGVRLVERSVTIDMAVPNNDTDVAESIAIKKPGLVERFVPKWAWAKRKGPFHLQQLSAGKRILFETESGEYQVLEGAGMGVDVYILDSGIIIDHKQFGGRASHFSQNDGTSPFTQQPSDLKDVDGHGTHVAGIAGASYVGVAPWSNLISVKVGCYKGGCKGHTAGIIDALDAVTKQHNDRKSNKPNGWKGSVINMSFVTTAKSKVLNRAIDRAFDAGIPLAVAGGNKAEAEVYAADGTLCESQNTICVGGVEKDYNKGWFSRDGKHIDLWAPGSDILSLRTNGGFMKKTGTSMASAQVAGIMAIIVGYEGFSDNALAVYQRVQANRLQDIVGRLKNPWFGDKENNYFAQTGAGLRNVNGQPYIGPPKDLTELIVPPGVFRKRQDGELQVDFGDGQAIKFPESDFWKTTGIIDTNPNDEIPAVAVQEYKLDTSSSETDSEISQPDFEDDSPPDDSPTEEEPQPDDPHEKDTINGKPICQGNQVWEDCATGQLPNSEDFSGQYGPVCMKADGTDGSKPRLSEQGLSKGASEYCQFLIDKKWLFKEGAPTPHPSVVDGVAENGAPMVLSIMYYKPGCPEDKSTSENFFGNMKLEDCVANLSQSISQVCGMKDPAWDKYNKDFTVMGGVYAKDCLLWTVYGQ